MVRERGGGDGRGEKHNYGAGAVLVEVTHRLSEWCSKAIRRAMSPRLWPICGWQILEAVDPRS